MISRPLIIVLAILFTGFLMSGWRTVSDAQRDEEVRLQLKRADLDAFRLEERVDDIDRRVKALEGR